MEGLGLADAHRRTVGVAVSTSWPLKRRDGQITRPPVRLRARLAEHADGDGDETGVGGSEGVEIDVHRLAVEHDVGGGRQRDEIDVVDTHRTLAPVVRGVDERALRSGRSSTNGPTTGCRHRRPARRR